MTVRKSVLSSTHRLFDTAHFTFVTLSNGIRVWIQTPKIRISDEGILAAILPRVGGIQDPPDKSGVSHYFEHVLSRGTERFPSREALFRPVKVRGGTADIASARSMYTYCATLLPIEHLATAAEALYQIVAEPLIRSEDVAMEQGVILEELALQKSTGHTVATWQYLEALFGAHPLRTNVLGTEDSIRSITAEDLRAFHHRFYHAGNVELICGGAFADRPDVYSVLDKHFGSWRVQEKAALPDASLLPIGKEGSQVIECAGTHRDSIRFLWLVPKVSFEDACAIEMLAAALSSGTDSLLLRALREKHGLGYEDRLVQAWYLPDCCLIQFYCPTDRLHFERVESIFRAVLDELDEAAVWSYQQQAQLARRRAFVSPCAACAPSRYTWDFDLPDQIVAYGWPISHHEWERKSDSVSTEHVLRWARYLLDHKPFVVELMD
ncbi:MAG: pitrilysin family protein [Patescibacteria group bacterium]